MASPTVVPLLMATLSFAAPLFTRSDPIQASQIDIWRAKGLSEVRNTRNKDYHASSKQLVHFSNFGADFAPETGLDSPALRVSVVPGGRWKRECNIR